MRRIAAFLVAVLWAAPVGAQTLDSLGRHGFGVEAGRLLQGIEDHLASSVRYEGSAAVAGVWYQYRGVDWRLGASLSRAGLRLSPAVGPRSSYEEATSMSFDAWALRRVWGSDSERWAVSAGPGVAGDMGLRRHYYRADQSTTYDNALLGLEATGLLEWTVPGLGVVSERVMLPVAGVAFRTAYTGLASSGPDVTVGLPPSFVLLRHRFEIRGAVGERTVIGFLYEGSLARHGDPLDLAVAWRRLGVSLELLWGRP